MRGFDEGDLSTAFWPLEVFALPEVALDRDFLLCRRFALIGRVARVVPTAFLVIPAVDNAVPVSNS